MNLSGEELKKDIYTRLQNAWNILEKEVDGSITFKFILKDGTKFIYKIEKGYGSYKYKNVYLRYNIAMLVFFDNISIDYFYHIDTQINETKPTIHGHGEYWGSKNITISYLRD